ncbi:MAG: IS110 family transposase [Prevotellaceae bacterium]|nr:IS110 family transposase [Prevotellaceae bacterium]
MSKKGNSRIRKAFYMSTVSKIRFDAPTEEYYKQLKEKKGKCMITVVATQRKLLALMYMYTL